MKIVKINIYKFDELGEGVRESVIKDEIECITTLETQDMWDEEGRVKPEYKGSNLYKAWKKSEDMLTPWFFGSYVYEYMKKEIMQRVRDNDYFSDGRIYNGAWYK